MVLMFSRQVRFPSFSKHIILQFSGNQVKKLRSTGVRHKWRFHFILHVRGSGTPFKMGFAHRKSLLLYNKSTRVRTSRLKVSPETEE